MDDQHTPKPPDPRLQKIINHLLGLDSASTKNYIEALVQEYQLENAQFYTADQKQFLKHYATNYAQFEKNKFDTTTHKGVLHRLYQLGKLAIDGHFSDDRNPDQQIDDYLELHSYLNQILANDTITSLVADFHFRKLKQINDGQAINDEQIADDAIDDHYKDTADIKDYLSKLPEDQVAKLGASQFEIARNVRFHLAKSIPPINITLFAKAVDEHFQFSHQSQLAQPLFILLARKLIPTDIYPESMSWNNFLHTQSERSASVNTSWTPVPLMPGLATAELTIPTVVEGLNLLLHFLDPGIGSKFPLLIALAFQLERSAQKSLILESDRVFSGDEVYLDRALYQRTIAQFLDRADQLVQFINVADVLDKVFFDISQHLPENSLNRDRNIENLLLASKTIREYDKIDGIKKSLQELQKNVPPDNSPPLSDDQLYLQADELFFHPDQKPSGLVDIFDTVKLLATREAHIIEPLLRKLGAISPVMEWDKFIKSPYWQQMVLAPQAIAILPTVIPGLDVVIDQWNGPDYIISVRINRQVRRNLVLEPARASLFGTTNASKLDRLKNRVSLLEEEIELARKKLPNLLIKIRAKGLWGLLGRKVFNPDYQALAETINQKEAELENLKEQIVDIS